MKDLKNVGYFTIGYILLSTVFAWYIHNWEFLYYIAIVMFLTYCGVLVHLHVGLSRRMLWALSIWGFLHMLGGLMPVPAGWPIHGDNAVLYSLWLIPNFIKYDHFVHFYGFGSATVLCWQALSTRLENKKPTKGVLLMCVLGGMGLGAFNEIVEFLAVLLVPETNVGGYANTGWDLVSNLLGCSAAAVWIRKRYTYSHDR